MPLTVGTRLGPYEVIELIGAGGMGEVYRARDKRLDRDVAIKTLPAVLVDNVERLRRFENEARAASLLSHPNILTIYDIGKARGHPYIVSELLEGETLRERLNRGRLPVKKSSEIAAGVADALAAAHGRGIVHRDLKPENLLLTRDGRVKILDFGIAKLMAPDRAEPGGAATVTIVTEAGVAVGTLGYMAPEQLRGEPADPRSDLFALGAIMYEMVSGVPAFKRASRIARNGRPSAICKAATVSSSTDLPSPSACSSMAIRFASATRPSSWLSQRPASTRSVGPTSRLTTHRSTRFRQPRWPRRASATPRALHSCSD